MAEPAFLRARTVAERWNCSPGKVRRMIDAGELPVLRLGTMIRLPLASIVEYEQRCLSQPAPASAASPAEIPGISIRAKNASLLAARIAHRLNRS